MPALKHLDQLIGKEFRLPKSLYPVSHCESPVCRRRGEHIYHCCHRRDEESLRRSFVSRAIAEGKSRSRKQEVSDE